MLYTTYTLHTRTLNLLVSISERLGSVRTAHLDRPAPQLEQAYRVSTVHATLALEGNPLERRPMADLMASRTHADEPIAIEVANTQQVHELLPELDPFAGIAFRRAHGVMMRGSDLDAGTFRTGRAEVHYGDHQTVRIADAKNLASQVEELLDYIETNDAPLIINSCVLHYAIAYVRPFAAGNGRMARLWQKRVLMRQWPVFAFLPVEAFILRNEPAYYAALEYADRQGDCGQFIVYLMEQLDSALAELLSAQRPVLSSKDRVALFLSEKDRSRFTRKDYRSTFPEISTATATRDLQDACEEGRIARTGSGRVTSYAKCAG